MDETALMTWVAFVLGFSGVYAAYKGESWFSVISSTLNPKKYQAQQMAGVDYTSGGSSASDASFTGTPNAAGLVNPIGKGLHLGRTDEGVDYTGSGPLYAMGDGVITNVSPHGWPGKAYILLHLDDGRYVYYAENITPYVHVGQRVKAGQTIGHANGTYPYVEIGWGTKVPGVALAHDHYTEGVPTPEGKDFLSLLQSLSDRIKQRAVRT